VSGVDLGAWQPATTGELVGLFSGAPFRWWMTGGVALELYAGRSWRDHADADVGICRRDAPAAHGWLRRLHPYVAAAGRLRPWDGGPLSAGADENNVWVKDRPDGPWRFDIAIGDGDPGRWTYRRDPTISRPWSETLMTTTDGVPYLAPEIQLLFKAKGLRPKDHVDAGVVIPLLDEPRRRWLAGHLPEGHPWLDQIGALR
jgi:hypothetical protein